LSDRLAVMRAGKFEQSGEIEAVYERPRTRFVGQFLGSCNLLDAAIAERRGESIVVDTALGPLRLAAAALGRLDRRSFSLAIRPEKVLVLPASEGAGENRFAARVAQIIYIGSETHYILEAGSGRLTAYALNAGAGAATYAVGDSCVAALPSSSLVVLED